ncbi:hypothetical protein NLL32_00715 [Corynebacterium propinquum]|uniref:hypothetical protein n=1 Tax=Corynebacterium propinquum TaxID=43769 RepID=UPI0025428781|nr:hypothetical protein [Corynebacterium propinquum]MDK4252608.1 hypothetical protein [Corynebacterium propinquum]WKS49454.1 hypothetical protein NLL32_00715 [Corynebacterium propinquum]
MKESSQVQYPNRASIRTFAAAVIGLLPLLPIIADAYGLTAIPWVAAVLVVTTGTTRLLATPAIAGWIETHLPWLSAEPPQAPKHRKDTTNE